MIGYTFGRRVDSGSASSRWLCGMFLWAAGLALMLELMPLSSRLVGDFAHFFYPAGREVVHGYLHYQVPKVWGPHNIAIYRYPPFAALLISPFALLPAHAAVVAWHVAALMSLGLASFVIASKFSAAASTRALVGGGIFLSFAGFAPLMETGFTQFDFWILLLVAIAFKALPDSRTETGAYVAGFCLGLGAGLKLYPLVILLIVVVLRPWFARQLLSGAAAAIAFSVLIPIPFVGTGALTGYVSVFSQLSAPSLVAIPFSMGFLGIAYRVLTHTPYAVTPFGMSALVARAAFVGFCAMIVVILARRIGPATGTGTTWAMALLVTMTCTPLLQMEYIALLALVPPLLAYDHRHVGAVQPMIGASSVPVGLIVTALLCVGCGVLGRAGLPAHALELVTVLAAALVASLAFTRIHQDRWRWAGAAFGWFFLASPGFLFMTLWGTHWSSPSSIGRVLVDTGQFVALLVVVLCVPTGSRSSESLWRSWSDRARGIGRTATAVS